MIRIKSHSMRSAFKAIQNSTSMTAALVFPHGIELLSVQTETGLQKQQLHRLLQDFRHHLAGVYGNEIRFEDFVDDVRSVTMELLLADDFSETID